MSESVGDSGVREVILLSSNSESKFLRESECRRLSDEVRSIVAELNKMPFGGQIDVGSSEGIESYSNVPMAGGAVVSRSQCLVDRAQVHRHDHPLWCLLPRR